MHTYIDEDSVSLLSTVNTASIVKNNAKTNTKHSAALWVSRFLSS